MENKRKCIICGSSQYLAHTEEKCLRCLTSKRRVGDWIVGIDPDREKSGVAAYSVKSKQLIGIYNLSFFDLYDFLSKNESTISLIRVEAGWLNKKANFHNRPGQSKTVGERIAKDVGANQETGKKIIEMCGYLSIPCEQVKPLGTKSIDSKLFQKITGYTKRTNQDLRDAAMLVWNYN